MMKKASSASWYLHVVHLGRIMGVFTELGLPCLGFTSRLEVGPSWVLVLRNALEITVEGRPLALEMCLHGQDDHPETWLKNGSFSPQIGPPCGTKACLMPYS